MKTIRFVIRSLVKDKFFTLLNVTGLAIGLGCVIVIVSQIRHDLSFDKFHSKGDRIFRLNAAELRKGERIDAANTSFPLGPAIAENFPEVEAMARFRQAFKGVVSVGQNSFKEPRFYFADEQVLKMFDFQLMAGRSNALSEPNAVVLTASTARRLFGTTDVMDRLIHYNGSGGERDLKITGILADLPENTHFDFEYLASMKSLNTDGLPWTWFTSLWTYVLLKDGTNPTEFLAKLTPLITKSLPQNEKLEQGYVFATGLEPLFDIHLFSGKDKQMKPVSDVRYLYLLGAVAMLVLVMVCFNFIGLSTARALKKSREVGIRKIIGATRRQLIGQFIWESSLLSVVGVMLACVILAVFHQQIGELLGFTFQVQWTNYWFAGLLFLMVFVVTVGAGLYPAIFLSSFKPGWIFRMTRSSRSPNLRRSLVAVQFSIASLMIFGTLLIKHQIDYIRNKNLGADIRQVVYVPNLRAADAFMSELSQFPEVESATRSSRLPANEESFDTRPVTVEGFEQPFDLESFAVDENFLRTYDVPLVAGRNLSLMKDTLHVQFLLNEAAVKHFGWSSPAEAIGKKIGWQKTFVQGSVAGVVGDFHLASLRDNIKPLILLNHRDDVYYEFISIRLATTDRLEDTLAKIGTLWKRYEPSGGYELSFVDAEFLRLHEADIRLASIAGSFSLVAILVAALGLFGLTNYMLSERTKELAVRKVLGADFLNMLSMLMVNFLKPVLIGCVIVFPLMYWSAQQWLSGFSYHFAPDGNSYLVPLSLAIGLAVVTILYRCIQSLRENPVHSLREQ